MQDSWSFISSDSGMFFTPNICKKWTAHSFIYVADDMVIENSVENRSN